MAAEVVKDLGPVDRDQLRDRQGRAYRDFRRTLTPRYGIVWRDIGAGYAALLGIGALVLWAYRAAPGAGVPVAVLGAVAFGYALTYTHLFIHEAGHFNVAPSRRANDWLANLTIGALIGLDVRAYRPVHFDHHRYLGTTQDPERSYFEPLNTRFVVEALTGIRLLKVLLRQRRPSLGLDGSDAAARVAAPTYRGMLAAGLGLNGAIVLAALLTRQWPLAAAWVGGMLIVFPFFASLRQLLEHRDENANDATDYAAVPHGEVNRLFGAGPVASTLGSAGFNRHLLHHWEPELSYTRFRELEVYLLDTEYADVLRSRTTTYAKTFARLFSW